MCCSATDCSKLSVSSGISIQKRAPCACLCFPNHSRTGNQTPAFRGKQTLLFHFPQLGADEKFVLPHLVLTDPALNYVSLGAVIRASFHRCEQDWSTLVGNAFNQI